MSRAARLTFLVSMLALGSVLVASGAKASTCGDSVLDTGEECDDGNVENGDGCSATCLFEPCDLSGTWLDTSILFRWSILEDGAGNFSGVAYPPASPGGPLQFTGTRAGRDVTFAFSETLVFPVRTD